MIAYSYAQNVNGMLSCQSSNLVTRSGHNYEAVEDTLEDTCGCSKCSTTNFQNYSMKMSSAVIKTKLKKKWLLLEHVDFFCNKKGIITSLKYHDTD